MRPGWYDWKITRWVTMSYLLVRMTAPPKVIGAVLAVIVGAFLLGRYTH